jgi:hypothetical protein
MIVGMIAMSNHAGNTLCTTQNSLGYLYASP